MLQQCLCCFRSVSRYSVPVYVSIYKTIVFACHLYISVILNLSCPELSLSRLGALGEEKGNVSSDNSRSAERRLIAVSVVSFCCYERSIFVIFFVSTVYLLMCYFKLCIIFFVLSRAKMTTAPYNYSYIFKYIIIGKWALSLCMCICVLYRCLILY